MSCGAKAGVIVAGLLMLLLVFPGVALGFADVAPDDWFASAVDELAQAGVIAGYPDGTFRPYELVTRAPFAGMLARALSVPDSDSHPFADVAPDDWFAASVAALYQAGLTSGVTATTFHPYGYLTREQAVSFTIRGLEYAEAHGLSSAREAAGLEGGPDDTESWLGAYRDRGYISLSHQPAVAAAYQVGIAGGYADERFYPFFSLTRAQATGIIHRAFYRPLEVKTDPPIPNPTEPYPVLRAGSSGDLVKWVETRLATLTYDRGAIDGVSMRPLPPPSWLSRRWSVCRARECAIRPRSTVCSRPAPGTPIHAFGQLGGGGSNAAGVDACPVGSAGQNHPHIERRFGDEHPHRRVPYPLQVVGMGAGAAGLDVLAVVFQAVLRHSRQFGPGLAGEPRVCSHSCVGDR